MQRTNADLVRHIQAAYIDEYVDWQHFYELCASACSACTCRGLSWLPDLDLGGKQKNQTKIEWKVEGVPDKLNANIEILISHKFVALARHFSRFKSGLDHLLLRTFQYFVFEFLLKS